MARKKKAEKKAEAPEPDSDDTKPFPFERLPPEMRNAVYEEYLVAELPIRITHTRGRRTPARLQAEGYGTPHPDEARPKAYLHVSYKDHRPVYGLNLLLTNKMVSGEASTILYGTNIFSFFSVPSMMTFLKATGSQAVKLRFLKLENWKQGHTHPCLELLAKTAHVREIVLPVLPPRRGAISFATILSEMGKAVQEFVSWDDTESERRDRFDSIRFTTAYPPYSRHIVHNGKGQRIEEEEVVMKYVRRQFERLLIRRGFLSPAIVKA